MTGRSGAERHESDERAMLRASVRALVAKHGGADDVWHRLCEQIGAAAVAIPETDGGAGGSLGDIVVVLDELGAGLVRSPMLGTAIAAAALSSAPAGDARSRLLEAICEGAAATVVFDPSSVVDLAEADVVLGVETDRLVEYDTATVRVTAHDTLDPSRSLASVDLTGASRVDLGPAGDIAAVAALLAAAEQVGTARRCLQMTVDHSATRIQFGRPIGSFQALKHRMADLYVQVEAARALVHDASTRLDAGTVAVASLYASECLGAVAAEAVQMHGGIGVTWEHDISWYFKRAHGSRFLFGTPRSRLDEVISAAGLL